MPRPTSPWPVPLTAGFRLFFLLAGLAAVGVMLRTISMLFGSGIPQGAPFLWHGHEMLFGYVAAVIAGFIVTAAPNWTGTEPATGLPVALTGALWLAARIGLWGGEAARWAIVADVVFLPAIAALVIAPLWRKRHTQQWLPVANILTLAALNILWHVALYTGSPYLAERVLAAATMVIAALIAIIGGRVTPAFTRNRLEAASQTSLPRGFGAWDRIAVGASVLVALAELVSPTAAAGIAGVAAVLHAGRLWGWCGSRVVREPLLLILHIGYAWLAVGYAVRALALVDPTWSGARGLHGLLVGAIGTMTLAMMTRASLGHTGRQRRAGPVMNAAFIAIQLAAVARLAGPEYRSVAGILWVAAFLLFLFTIGPALVRERQDASAPGITR